MQAMIEEGGRADGDGRQPPLWLTFLGGGQGLSLQHQLSRLPACLTSHWTDSTGQQKAAG